MLSAMRIESLDRTSWIELSIRNRSEEELRFQLEATFGSFRGSIESTTYLVGSPAIIFAEAARDWRGWKGERVWEAIDHELCLSLSTDSQGHYGLHVSIKREEVKLEGWVAFEAAQIDQVAQQVALFFRETPIFP